MSSLGFLGSIYERDDTVFIFLCLTYLTCDMNGSPGPFMSQMAEFPYFSWLNCISFIISSSLSIDGCKLFTIIWLLWMMLQQTWEWIYFFNSLFSFCLDIYLEEDYWSYGISILNLLKNLYIFLQCGWTIYNTSHSAKEFPFFHIFAKTSYLLSFSR